MLVPAVLLQTATQTGDFFKDHSEVVKAIIGGQFAMIGSLLLLLLGVGRWRFSRIDKDLSSVGRRLEKVEVEVQDALTQLSSSKEDRNGIHSAIQSLDEKVVNYMAEEERTVWAGMEKLTENLSGMRIDSERRITKLEEGQGSILKSLDEMKLRMPNGEYQRIAKALEQLLVRMKG